jgi:hypothetical protein
MNSGARVPIFESAEHGERIMSGLVLRSAAIASFFFAGSALYAHDITVNIDSKTKVMTLYKVVVKGVIKISVGESYDSLTPPRILNLDDGETSVDGNMVSLTKPVKQGDGSWTDGSYEWYATTSLEGNWVAQIGLIYIDLNGKQASQTGLKQFVLP